MHTATAHPARGRGDVVWTPDPARPTNLDTYTRWLENRLGRNFGSYQELWDWSVEDLDGFWSSIIEFFDVRCTTGPVATVGGAGVRDRVWLPGARLNWAEHALRGVPEQGVLVAVSQTRARRAFSRAGLRGEVARARAGLRALGVGTGDRVVGFVPNTAEAVVSLLAAASLGAVWASCPPEFGAKAVVDRLGQLDAKVLVTVDGYRHRGRSIDRRDVVEDVRRSLVSVEHTVVVPHLDPGATIPDAVAWDDLGAATDDLEFEPVAAEHPLYVLFSSGTTGAPKAIVHGHGGILLEHLKALALHHDVGPGDRFCWNSTTGWMMWNYAVSALLTGGALVQFDGDPTYPTGHALWDVAAAERVTILGMGAGLLEHAAGLPGLTEGRDLGALRQIGSTGSPLASAAYHWVAKTFDPSVQPVSISGGTDVCTAFIGMAPTEPVRAGEMTVRFLGAAVEAWDEDGRSVVDTQGELVVTQPMPSMPVGFWADPDGTRLTESYFARFPGIWHHGDWLTVHADGSCVITGRSDATLNRGGVRLGTAELYEVVEASADVRSSLAVHALGALVLLVEPTDTYGSDTVEQLRAAIRKDLSPRHVPDDVVAVPGIPLTASGKKLELSVKRYIEGATLDQVLPADLVRSIEVVETFRRLAELRTLLESRSQESA